MIDPNNQQEQYPEGVQRLLLSYMVSEPNSFSLCQNILKPEYFVPKLRPAVRHVLDYAEKYRALPTIDQIEGTTGVAVKVFEDAVSAQHMEWFLGTIEGFCRNKALELAVMEGPDLIAKGAGAEVEKRIREAMTISLMTDLGMDYFDNPKARLERLKDRSNFFTTGWKTLDEKLYGGFSRGALNIFAGGSGSGKSLFLQNISLNWAMMGLNVVYFSLELSEELVSMRIDSMTSGIATKEVLKKINEVAIAVTQKGKKAGDFRIKTLHQGATVNDLRAYLKEYEIQTGKRVDAIVVDYLDLMHPNDRRINISDQFIKDKYTSEEMRGLAREMDCFCVTASQLNRQSVEASEFDHSHIAGGISKINTADNVFGIFTTAHMRENGEYQLQFLKTRSSSAVGQKIKLKFRPDCLLILDPDENEGSELLKPKSASEIQETLKVKAQQQASGSAPHLSPVNVEEGQSTSQRIMDLMRKARNQ